MCPPNDERQQLVVFRDPRPAVVSTFFHLKRKALSTPDDTAIFSMTIDEYVLKMLPTLCQWLAVRYMLFETFLVKQSNVSRS